MNLLRDIQQAAIEDAPLPSLLRRCRVLAQRLDHQPLMDWSEHELNGYADAVDIPDYRQCEVAVRGHFFGMFQSELKNAPIAPAQVEEKHRDALFKWMGGQGVAAYEDLLRRDEGTFQESWPQNTVIYYQDRLIERMTLAAAWKVIPRGTVLNVLEHVRNGILTFALDIEKENPEAGEAEPGTHPIDPSVVTNLFTTNIYGSQNIVAAGVGNAITAPTTVNAGDLEALNRALAALGLSDADIAQLGVAIGEDDPEPDASLGPRVRDWLARQQVRVASGALNLATNAGGNVLAQLLLSYYGAL